MVIHGTGCCLIDFLYANEDFSSLAFKAARSRTAGDGGLTPGKLVFAEDFERFMGKPYEEALGELTGRRPCTSYNLGGPSVVSLAHAAQMLGREHRVSFFGVRGGDSSAALVEKALASLPFASFRLIGKEGATPRTDVLSDPNYDGGHGERTFINLLGAAANLAAEDLSKSAPDFPEEDFYNADIIAFGGTGLTPLLHDSLRSPLLEQSAGHGAATVVNLVYDFRGENTAPGGKWKLGVNDDAYPLIDLLIADREEALRTSGCSSTEEAASWFLGRGTGAVIITDGARPVILAAGKKGLFAPLPLQALPVSEKINQDLAAYPERRGDTTGCGDNLAGGVIAGMAEQLSLAKRGAADLRECAAMGIVSGGFACFTVGGTCYESREGEKRALLEPYLAAYRRQIADGGQRCR
ncbi:MAG: carbohydrate kinase family protein [Spirochaetaceae bacterium]|nr:carbohydrate kinase family protein [Spirochaetaceae bacterium]